MSDETLPDGWKRIAFGQIATRYYSGGTPASGNPAYWGEGKPWTTSASIEEDAVLLAKGSRLITECGIAESASSVVPTGSLLVGTRVGVGKAVVAETDIAISQDLTGVTLSKGEDALFLAYQFKSEALQAYFEGRKRGAIIKGVSRQDLADATILLPPLDEQRAIASVLRAVQDARDARRAERAAEAERRAWLLDRLFTHGTRGKAVEMMEFGQLIEEGPQNGVYFPQSAYGQGIPILRINDFDNDGRLTTPRLLRVEASKQSIHRFALRTNDLVINRVNSLTHLGKSLLVPDFGEAVMFESNMMRLRVDGSKLLPAYAGFYLVSPQARTYLRSRATHAVAQSSINQSDVRSLPVHLPPLDEQREIAEVLAACDAALDALDAEAARLDELFRSLLDELMTGRRSARALLSRDAG